MEPLFQSLSVGPTGRSCRGGILVMVADVSDRKQLEEQPGFPRK
jgi:hypothetical protein